MSTLPLVPAGPEAAGPDGQPSRQPPRRRGPPAPQADEDVPAQDPGQRLMIEEIDAGHFVYTVIDRASGSVVAKTSREDVSTMGARADYAAGALIRAKA